jgi:hypothetical protein
MNDDKDGHIPSPLIIVSCTALSHALLEWQNNKGVHPKASKSKLTAYRPDRSNYFNCKNNGVKIAFCSAGTDRKLLTPPGVSDMYTILMNTWNTIPGSYQQRVYNMSLATVKRQIQQAENSMPAVVISVQAARVDNSILRGYLTSEVELEKPEIRCTDPNIPKYNNCTNDHLHFGMPVGSGDVDDEAEQSDAIPTTSRRRRAGTGPERVDLGTTDFDGYEGEDGDDADADEEEERSQAEDGSMQNVED